MTSVRIGRLLFLAISALAGANACEGAEHARRVEGLLIGAMIGDAAGGPVEFRPPDASAAWLPRCRDWPEERRVDSDTLRDFAESFRLTPYADLRPGVEPYGQWSPRAAAGTLTDDTRHKIVLIEALRSKGGAELTANGLARAYLRAKDLPAVRARPDYARLHAASFGEFERASRWVLGERDLRRSAPPDRLWAGLPTCCGQMTMTPLAALYPGRPREAYLACYDAAFFDVGAAKDLNSAIVAGLAAALSLEPPTDAAERAGAWASVIAAMRLTDPLNYRGTPFVRRPIDRWTRFAAEAVKRAGGRPKRLYSILEEEGEARTYWEAHATLAQAFAAIEFCDYEPLAAMTLLLDFGHDTDSTAQLLGAFIGAVHGPEVFPNDMRQAVRTSLAEDYGESLDAWVDLLVSRSQRE